VRSPRGAFHDTVRSEPSTVSLGAASGAEVASVDSLSDAAADGSSEAVVAPPELEPADGFVGFDEGLVEGFVVGLVLGLVLGLVVGLVLGFGVAGCVGAGVGVSLL